MSFSSSTTPSSGTYLKIQILKCPSVLNLTAARVSCTLHPHLRALQRRLLVLSGISVDPHLRAAAKRVNHSTTTSESPMTPSRSISSSASTICSGRTKSRESYNADSALPIHHDGRPPSRDTARAVKDRQDAVGIFMHPHP